MFRSWYWLVPVLITLILIAAVTIWGNCLLTTPWGNVGLNVVSDFFFVVFLSLLFGGLYWAMLARARRFFGIDHALLQICISSHKDETTSTKKVLTAEEYEIAQELRTVLKRQFPDFIPSWARLFGVNLEALDIAIIPSPLKDKELGDEEVTIRSRPGGLILLGGPTRNSLTAFYLDKGNPWIKFVDEEKKFYVWRNGQGWQELQDSGRLALLEKLVVDGKTVIVAFGFGESGTSAAARHLANEWKTLLGECGKKRQNEFARLLYINDNGRVQIQEEIFGSPKDAR